MDDVVAVLVVVSVFGRVSVLVEAAVSFEDLVFAALLQFFLVFLVFLDVVLLFLGFLVF